MTHSYHSTFISRQLFSLFVIFSSLLFVTSAQADSRLTGQWQGVDSDGDEATFVFNTDQSAEILFAGLPPLTSKNIMDGDVVWNSDAKGDSIHLDVMIVTDAVVTSRIVMLVNIIDTQTLKIQMSRDMKTRPHDFEISKSEFQIIATRQ